MSDLPIQAQPQSDCLVSKIHAKYFLRPITKKLPKKTLLFLIKKSVPLSLLIFEMLKKFKLALGEIFYKYKNFDLSDLIKYRGFQIKKNLFEILLKVRI